MNNQPSKIADLVAFKFNDFHVHIDLEDGIDIVAPVTVVFGIGDDIQNTVIPVTVGADQIDFTLTAAQLQALPANKKVTVYVKFADDFIFAAPIKVTTDGAIAQSRTIKISFPSVGTVRTSIYDDEGIMKQARQYRDEAKVFAENSAVDWIEKGAYNAADNIPALTANATIGSAAGKQQRYVVATGGPAAFDGNNFNPGEELVAGEILQQNLNGAWDLLPPGTGLKGATVDDSGKLEGAYSPTVVFENYRKEAEFAGNNQYTGRGVAWQERVSSRTSFNFIELPLWVEKSIGSATVKIFKSPFDNYATPGALNEIYSLDIPFANLSRDKNVLTEMLLPDNIYVEKNEVVYVYVYGTSNVYWKIWTAQAGDHPRYRFIFTGALTTPWASGWELASDPFYQASFRLSNVDYKVKKELIENKKREDKRLLVPSKLYATVGIPQTFYYDAAVLCMDGGLNGPLDCTVYFEHPYLREAGVARGSTITPDSGMIGTQNLYSMVFDRYKKQFPRKTSTLKISANSAPDDEKIVCIVGDSVTEAEDGITVALAERFAALSGTNKPILVGTKGSGDAKHQGHSGWGWHTFTSNHPDNPFWNPATSQVDFTYYRTQKLGLDLEVKIDEYSFMLGINNAWGGGNLLPNDEYIINEVINNAKLLCEKALDDNSNCKIIIQLTPTSKSIPWTTSVSVRKDVFMQNLWRIREMLAETFDYNAFHANVYVGHAGLCMDRYFGYPLNRETPVGYRYPDEFEDNIGDSVHPRPQGSKQLGDAMFPQILEMLKQ